jgi:hypothetical protein
VGTRGPGGADARHRVHAYLVDHRTSSRYLR